VDDIDLFPAAMAENPADSDALLGESTSLTKKGGYCQIVEMTRTCPVFSREGEKNLS
jgi:hypothetical protein